MNAFLNCCESLNTSVRQLISHCQSPYGSVKLVAVAFISWEVKLVSRCRIDYFATGKEGLDVFTIA